MSDFSDAVEDGELDATHNDLTDQWFYNLEVLDYAYRTEFRFYWQCKCKCGMPCLAEETELKRGIKKSCGCTTKDLLKNKYENVDMRSEYRVWNGMKQRCLNPKSKAYKDYGGRGIKICRDWLYSFKLFYQDMGPRPTPHHSIDRINVDGNYDPSNCKWATATEQANNKRNTRYVDYEGKRYPLTQICRDLNLDYSLTSRKLGQGISMEDIVEQLTKED